jgi:ribosomal protein S18 acetylase RimI-like enzyme
VRPEEWRGFRELRLRALRTDPLAFGSTEERERAFPDAEWVLRCERGATEPRSPTFVAVDADGTFRGMAGAFPAEGSIQLWGMWVDPSARGRGLGGALLDRLLGYLAELGADAEVALEVNPDQRTAVALYLRRGFRPDGTSRALGHHPSARVDRYVRRSSAPARR